MSLASAASPWPQSAALRPGAALTRAIPRVLLVMSPRLACLAMPVGPISDRGKSSARKADAVPLNAMPDANRLRASTQVHVVAVTRMDQLPV